MGRASEILTLIVLLSDLCGWITVDSAQTVPLHHAGGQRPQPGQVGSSTPLMMQNVCVDLFISGICSQVKVHCSQ